MLRIQLPCLLVAALLCLLLVPTPVDAQVDGCWPKRVPQRCTFIRDDGTVGTSCQTMIVNGNSFRRNGTIEIRVDGNPNPINARVVVAKPEQHSGFCRFEYTQPVEEIQCKDFQVHPRFQGTTRDLLFWGDCSNGIQQVCFTVSSCNSSTQAPSQNLIQQLQ